MKLCGQSSDLFCFHLVPRLPISGSLPGESTCSTGNNVVKGGTPVGSASLCRTCSHALAMSGYRESERLTVCSWPAPSMAVPFVIHECSGYYDKNRPGWKQMQELALNVVREPIKPVGFKTGMGFGERVTLARPAEEDED